MELQALNESLSLIEHQNLLPIEIHVDSIEVISGLANGNLLYNSIIDECRSKLRRLGSPQVVHCYGEQNGVADAMAKLGS